METRKNKKFIDEKVKEISKSNLVLDVGGGEPFTKWLSEYKGIFDKCDYKTMDYDRSTSPDIVGDIHNIPLQNDTVDAIICNCVLEHVENPILAVKEMYRVLKPGGKVFVHVPSIYPYHARKGHYPDYWRFFDDTIEVLFKEFKVVEMQKRGGYFKALMFFLPLQHKLRFVIDPLSEFLDNLFGMEKRNTTSGYYIYAVK
ncbi:MAG: class I SAM-dependent methyltransferase [Parcubacteria group bacterium]